MRKFLFLTGLLICALTGFAQVSEQAKNAALQLVRQNRAAIGLPTSDPNDVIVSSTYLVTGTDITMVYLQQAHKGIPVYNQLKTLAFRGGKLVSNFGEHVLGMEKLTGGASEIPSISAVKAVETSLADAKVAAKEAIVPVNITLNGKKMEFGRLGASKENIITELIWMPAEDGRMKLAWQVFVAPNNSSDMWLTRVDARSSQVISKQNLTITCIWEKEEHSVAEHFAENHEKKGSQPTAHYIMQRTDKQTWEYKPFVIGTASYRVIRYPAESPQHPGGAPSIHTDPWTMAAGNATSLKWHSDPVDYNTTRGNNVWAQEDRNANDGTSAAQVTSTTALPNLTFDFVYDFAQEPAGPLVNQQAAVVNLFYFNNILHDITYLYGFDEVSGNFQEDNQGRGGLGSDHVFADAQDGSGLNNANFGTPVDGSNPRMQMFLWNTSTPGRDGDLDNGIIAHEFTHGVSNRMTGGPGNVSCLGNAEHGGEGWSDYFCLMTTTNWATATINDGPIRRGIGTYALNQPTNGVGIRRFPYSTDMSIYPLTYADLPGSVAPHGVGEVWCMMLWEMTWEIIKQDNAINPNLFNPGATTSAMIGNSAAFKLVMEGMRLQPCSPGFVDARNAILQADQLHFGGRYACAIWKAFAKRGLGRFANQGSSNNKNDGIADFTVDAGSFALNPDLPAVLEGNNLVYTNVVTSGECTPMTNFTLRDTLPLSVTWVSGGTYNAGDRTVSWPVNMPINSTQNFVVTVNVNPGTYFAPTQFINDPVTAIAPNWTANSSTANVWSTSGTSTNSAPLAFFTPDAAVVSDQTLMNTNPIVLPTGSSAFSSLSFWHRFNTETGFDGCVVEITTNGGGSWSDLGQYMTGARYNGVISTLWSSPIAGRSAFTGNSGTSFQKTTVNLAAFAGQTIQIRFRLASDVSLGGTGWFVDDILLESAPFVFTKAGLYDDLNARVNYKDTLTPILSAVGCVNPAITSQPASVVRCSTNGNGVFTVVATGTSLNYQWELSTNNGGTWAPIPTATGASYTIVNPTTALNGNLYRVVITGACGSPVTSAPAAMYVSPALVHSAVSATPANVCVGNSSALTATVSGGTAGTNGLIGSSGVLNQAIPDNNPAGISSTITLPSLSMAAAANLKIRLNLTHTWVGDVRVTLTTPCGATLVFDRPGVPATTFGNGADLSGVYIFDIGAATVLPETGAVPAGTYSPSNTTGAAHPWTGLTFPCAGAGAWTLNISDNGASDNGTLADWAILLGGNYTHSLTGPGTITPNAPGGANNSVGNFTVSALPAGTLNYTLVSTDVLGCTVSSNIVVSVTGAPTITTQPSNSTICQNGNTTFTVVDNAPLPPAYQWQVSSDGGGLWTNLANVPPFSGVNTSTLTITGAGLVYNGNLFRVVITNTCGTATSNNATLTVNPLPIVNSGPSGLCAPVTLTASGNANTYSWSPATGLNTTTGPVVIASPTVTTVYTVTGTITATGCQNTASVTVLGTPATPVITPAAPVICAGTIQALSVPPTSFTSSGGAVTINALGNGTPYPTTTTITGLPTTGARVKAVRLNGLSHTFPADIDIVLQSPSGQNVILMSDAGAGTDIVNVNLVFDDAAAGILPATVVSGTFRPTNTAGPDNFPAPGPGNITNVNPTLSTFTGNMNGTWNLFVVDDLAGDGGSLTSWSIEFEVPTAVWSPVTGLFTNPAATIPYVAGTPASTVYFLQSPTAVTTYTYTVTNVLGTCSSAPATVTVTVNPVPTISVGPNNQCGPVTLTATGNANTYTWSPATGLNTTTGATVTANPQLNTTYTVTGAFTSTGCTASATVTVNARPPAPVVTPSAINICAGSTTTLTVTPVPITTPNGGAIAIPGGAGATSGVADPYPAQISVGGLPVAGVRVKSVQINGISHTFPSDIDMVLQAPNGQNIMIMSDAGGGTDIVNANLVFDDAAATNLPAVIVSGTYKPTNTAGPDNFPAPGPGSVSSTGPRLSDFTGDLNGNWRLWINDQFAGDAGNITSWSITFELTGAIWTPVTGLFTNPTATIPYVAGTVASVVYAKPAATTTYTVSRASSTCAANTSTATVTVYQPVIITTHPANVTVCQGGNATFTVVSSGNFLTYQWQVSTDGGTTWNPVTTNGQNASLVLTGVTPDMNNNRYRVVINNSCGTATSNAATLTVNQPTPVVATDLWNRVVCYSDSLIQLVGTPVGGSWSGPGVSGFNFIPGATAVGTYTLTYSYTNSFGCVSSDTTKVIVRDCAERIRLLQNDAVILFPNPNNGQFNIRINSTLYNYLGMRVYNMAGQLLKVQEFGSLYYGRTIPINLGHLPSATYLVKFYYDDGVRSSEKGFLVVVNRD